MDMPLQSSKSRDLLDQVRDRETSTATLLARRHCGIAQKAQVEPFLLSRGLRSCNCGADQVRWRERRRTRSAPARVGTHARSSVATLGADVARQGPALRRTVTAGVRQQIARIASLRHARRAAAASPRHLRRHGGHAHAGTRRRRSVAGAGNPYRGKGRLRQRSILGQHASFARPAFVPS